MASEVSLIPCNDDVITSRTLSVFMYECLSVCIGFALCLLGKVKQGELCVCVWFSPLGVVQVKVSEH